MDKPFRVDAYAINVKSTWDVDHPERFVQLLATHYNIPSKDLYLKAEQAARHRIEKDSEKTMKKINHPATKQPAAAPGDTSKQKGGNNWSFFLPCEVDRLLGRQPFRPSNNTTKIEAGSIFS